MLYLCASVAPASHNFVSCTTELTERGEGCCHGRPVVGMFRAVQEEVIKVRPYPAGRAFGVGIRAKEMLSRRCQSASRPNPVDDCGGWAVPVPRGLRRTVAGRVPLVRVVCGGLPCDEELGVGEGAHIRGQKLGIVVDPLRKGIRALVSGNPAVNCHCNAKRWPRLPRSWASSAILRARGLAPSRPYSCTRAAWESERSSQLSGPRLLWWTRCSARRSAASSVVELVAWNVSSSPAPWSALSAKMAAVDEPSPGRTEPSVYCTLLPSRGSVTRCGSPPAVLPRRRPFFAECPARRSEVGQ